LLGPRRAKAAAMPGGEKKRDDFHPAILIRNAPTRKHPASRYPTISLPSRAA
jgi:hypothetical protein